MKNQVKDANEKRIFKAFTQNNFLLIRRKIKGCAFKAQPFNILYQIRNLYLSVFTYFLMYITSFTSFTVRGTSGNAAATKLGA